MIKVIIMIFSCTNIEKSFGVTKVLHNITFKLEDREKIAIIGVNGSGKSTLLKIIAGIYTHDNGDLFLKKEISIGYLSQDLQLDPNKTILEEATTVFKDLIEKEKTLRYMEEQMKKVTEPKLASLMEEYEKLSHEFLDKNGYSYQSRIQGVLTGLGFKKEEFNQVVKELSGGQKSRLNLTKLLLQQPDFLLLDEPTNHLDIDAISWLENYVKNYPSAVIIVSHDRYFIDQTTTAILEIENGKSSYYKGKYHDYANKKAIDRRLALKHFLDQQKIIKKQEESIALLYSYNQEKKIRRAKSKQKQLDKLERIEKPETLPEAIRISFKPKRSSGFEVLTVDSLAMAFDKPLFKNVSFTVKKNDRIAIIGPNGIGKTTLFNILLDKLTPINGQIRYGTNVDVGYFNQEQANLSLNKTIFEEIHDQYPSMNHQEVRNALAWFQFKGDDVFKDINVLSGGEKSRVALVELLLQQANFLILDEPTNHLDIQSKEILEDALEFFEGTILFISHDRYFINKIATKIVEFSSEGTTTYEYKFQEYLFHKKENTPIVNQVSANQLDYQEQKRLQSLERKKIKKIERLEQQINSIEEEIKELEEVLLSPEVIEDYIKYNDLQQVILKKEEELTILLSTWEELTV